MPWLLSLHLIFMVTWFSALFYLPRLFVYHAMSSDSISVERFKVMEGKLYYGIMWPGGILTTLFGLGLLFTNLPFYSQALWMQLKLAVVVLVWAYHFYCGYLLKRFKEDCNAYGHVFYRWLNEIPVLFLAAIVILVMIQPF